jgi:hypothetical protein
MSFSERRYESHGASDPIFGIQSTLWAGSNAFVPIIPNIGSRWRLGVNHPHIAFQKITCPSGSLSDAVLDRSLIELLPILQNIPGKPLLNIIAGGLYDRQNESTGQIEA